MTINERFQHIINSMYNGNKRAFSNAVGISPTVTENIVGSRQGKPSYEILCKVCANANISEQWLLSEQGEMLKSKRSSEVISLANEAKSDYKVTKNRAITQDISVETRPRIPFDAAAGSLSDVIGSVRPEDCEQIPVIPTFPRYDFTIFARGNSMEPQYLSGDELACLLIKEKSFIQWGRPHVLDTAQGIVVKRIFDAGDSILCKSYNPEYPDYKILKSDIYRMAIVVGSLRIE